MSSDSQGEFWIGFDLGGTKMLAAAFDESLELISRKKDRTKALEGTEAVIDRIIEAIGKVIEKSGRDKAALKGIGIGVPGTIDLQSGVVLEAPNLGWKEVPLQKILRDKFKCEVVLCNDVDAGLYGEYAKGAAAKSYISVGIFPGTGVGGGCVIDGRLLQGKTRTGMEVGHIPFYSGGPRDGANNEGTLETVASRLAISSNAAQAVFRGVAPFLKEEAGTDISMIRSGTLAASIKNGDTSVKEIAEHAATYIGRAIVTLVHLFAPDCVVLGGGLVEAMPEIFVTGPLNFAQKTVLKSFKGTYQVVAAELGDDSAIIGAAAWARKSIQA